MKNKTHVASLGNSPADVLNSWKSEAKSSGNNSSIAGRIEGEFTFCFAEHAGAVELSVRLDSSGDVTRKATPEEKIIAVSAISNGLMHIEAYDKVKGKYRTLHENNGVKLALDRRELTV